VLFLLSCFFADVFSDDPIIRIFPFLKGAHFESPQREQWQTEKAAQFLGVFHKVSSKMVHLIPDSIKEARELNLQRMVDLHNELAPDFSKQCPEFYRRISKCVDDTISKGISDMEFLPTGLIHADFHDLNVLFSEKEKKLSAVLDWDCVKGPFIYDVAGGLLFWCCKGTSFDFSFDLARVFLAEYQKFREYPLTDLEKKLIRRFMFFVGTEQFNHIEEVHLHGKDVLHFLNAMLRPLEFLSQVTDEEFLQKCFA